MWLHNPGDCSYKDPTCDGYGEYVIDPYARDIAGVEVYEWLCEGAYREKVMSI